MSDPKSTRAERNAAALAAIAEDIAALDLEKSQFQQPTVAPPAADIPADELRSIPRDLRLALMAWWRAHHHGSVREEAEAAETLCEAIGPRIAGLREIEHGKQF